jgi:hypothetical protein
VANIRSNQISVYQQFIYGKSGLKVDEIKTAVQSIDSPAPAGSNSVSLNIPLNGFDEPARSQLSVRTCGGNPF